MEKRICIFTGSRLGARSEYSHAARQMARELVRRGYGLVYGGGNVGLMGVLADEMLESGGHVTGVIPDILVEKELAHAGLTHLRIVTSMHERKAVMAELAHGFVALPGGIGTMEEFFEVLSWAQLGIHEKPCGVLNTDGYFDHLIRFLDSAVDEDFLKPKHRALVLVEGEPVALLNRFDAIFAKDVPTRLAQSKT